MTEPSIEAGANAEPEPCEYCGAKDCPRGTDAVSRDSLQALLDKVDARDSLLTLETIDTLRDQLRKVEGERDGWRRKAEHLNHQALCGLSAAGICTPVEGFIEAGGAWLDYHITELNYERQREKVRADDAERERDELKRHYEEALECETESFREQLRPLEALRSLLPDVRACAEHCISCSRSGEATTEATSRILAALDSRECPECHMPGHHKMS